MPKGFKGFQKRHKINLGKISSLKGKKRPPFSNEWREKIRLANKGKKRHPLSEEHKKKLSLAKIGNKNGFKKNQTPWNKGKQTGIKPWKDKKRPELSFNETRSKKISEYAKKMVKEGKHPFWKGGITPINSLIRTSREMCKWRKLVFQRDNYTCQECKVRGCELNAHHIKSFALYPELRFDINNGETLCKDCHKKTDSFLKNKIYVNN